MVLLLNNENQLCVQGDDWHWNQETATAQDGSHIGGQTWFSLVYSDSLGNNDVHNYRLY